MTTYFRRPKFTIPPLENGDRLSRLEFERRYQAMPDVKKAELIEGIVFLASPLRFEPHAEPHADLIGWLWMYEVATPGVRLGNNPTVRLDRDNELQPDAVLRLDARAGGQSQISEDGYIEGAPELVAEISASTASIDLGDKLRVYRRSGVKEYLVWQVFDERIDWFLLDGEDYIELNSDEEGVIRSCTFPGLWLSQQSAIVGDMSQVVLVLEKGLASPDHQALIASMEQPGG
ncbi:uncharacterized protein conserved in cyanobacteria [Rubidibacter lacunae KORDI 51-2]|uniref:Uncharacterized protein conserved in cyanobacteria n=1 Tax=Rubidibacter lacunae KORDI 51-2 TaxID=582515 RepID=U5D906_9CHRO|nr:Uma2 family endonuclease [Rubidibacter lacunae]ERN41073.1 uncharacterized protein conserved in cyanobacteria [Rubidibacter lacunae KORDI 51-2]